jgi:hypothetical protein
MRTSLRSSDRAWLDGGLLQGVGGYLIDDATASASDSSGQALAATIAPKQSNSTKRCRGASDSKKSLLISRNDRDPRGINLDIGFIFGPPIKCLNWAEFSTAA